MHIVVHYNYYPYNIYFEKHSEKKIIYLGKESFSWSLHTHARHAVTGIAFKEMAVPFPAGKFTRRHYLVAIKFIRRVVSARNLYSTRNQEPCIIGLSQRGDRKHKPTALRAARFESIRAYVRT